MLLGIPRSARCVQRFDDSLNSAIHITYRISLRSSSMREPRDPLLKVVFGFNEAPSSPEKKTSKETKSVKQKEHQGKKCRNGSGSTLTVQPTEQNEETRRRAKVRRPFKP